MNTATLKKTYLYELHQQSKAKLTPFGGYLLPVWHSSIKEEHVAVRQSVGAFDISHMGLLEFSGEEALAFLQNINCNDMSKSIGGKMVYSMVLNEQGGVKDDVMVGGLENSFIMVLNASNKDKIVDWINTHKPDSVSVRDLNLENGFLAVQGPQAVQKLGQTLNLDLAQHGRFSVFREICLGIPCILMRTGYTGEDGFEMIVPKDEIGKIWTLLMENGVTPCGLGARDTLRMEAGLPLYGQELGEDITPLMTRYKWVLKLDKEFIGKEALVKQKDEKPAFATVGIEMEDHVIPRTGYVVKEGGHVTSGTLSPSLGKPIGMALVNPDYSKIGDQITVEIRGKDCKAKVVPVPFK